MTKQRNRLLLNKLPGTTHFRRHWKEQSEFNFSHFGYDGMVLLEFLIYRCLEKQGWVCLSKENIEGHTFISPYRQDTLSKMLVKAGILERELRGVPATLHYRIRFDQLANHDRLALIYSNLSRDRERELSNFFMDASFVVNSEVHKPRQENVQ